MTKTPPIPVPPGYRLLELGEQVPDGYMFYRGSTGTWIQPTVFGSRHGERNPDDGRWRIAPIPVAPANEFTPAPPPGYRMLDEGDVIPENYLIWDTIACSWLDGLGRATGFENIGSSSHEHAMVSHIR